jgi:hypothetical protein
MLAQLLKTIPAFHGTRRFLTVLLIPRHYPEPDESCSNIALRKIPFNINLFKAYWSRDAPTGLTFNNFMLFPLCIYVFSIYLRTNSKFCPIQHKLIGFYNRDEKCLQRGTNWVFK